MSWLSNFLYHFSFRTPEAKAREKLFDAKLKWNPTQEEIVKTIKDVQDEYDKVKEYWDDLERKFTERAVKFEHKALLEAGDRFIEHAEAYMKTEQLGEKVDHYVKTAAALEKMKVLVE